MTKQINSFEFLTEAIIERSVKNLNFSGQDLENLKKIFGIPIKSFLMESFSNQLFNKINQRENLASLSEYYGNILGKFLYLKFVKNSKKLLDRSALKTFDVDAITSDENEIQIDFINFFQNQLSDFSTILSNKREFIEFLLIENKSLTEKDFAKIIEINFSAYDKEYFIQNLIKNKSLEKEHFLKIAEVTVNLSANLQKHLAESYLKTINENSVDTTEIFANILSKSSELSIRSQRHLREKYVDIKKHLKQEFSLKEFITTLFAVSLNEEYLANSAISYFKTWEMSPANFIIMLDIVKDLLDVNGQEDLIDTFLEINNGDLEAGYFVKILSLATKLDGAKKYYLITQYITIREIEIKTEDFVKILNSVKDLNEKNQAYLIAAYSNLFLKDLKLEDLLIIFNNTLIASSNDLTIKFDPELVVITYKNILSIPNIKPISEKINNLEFLIDIVKQLHPQSELLQFDILLEAAGESLIKKDHLFFKKNSQNLTDSNQQKNSSALNEKFLDYINEAQSDNLVMKLITALQEKNLLENEERTLLQLVKGRTAKRFQFIKELFEKGKEFEREKLLEFFTEEGFETLKNLFGEDYLRENTIGILDIISYYDAKNQIPSVVKMLKQDFRKTLGDNLETPKGDFLIKPEEVTKLSQITDIPLEKIKKKLISNEVLCEYFLKKVSGNLSGPDPFRDLSDEEKAVYQINFTGFIPDVKEKEQEQRLQDINRKFKEILTSGNLMEGDVVEFFRLTMGNNLAINQTNSAKLFDFFKKSKNELAYLLSQPEGISKIVKTIHSLGDGCSANIGTHFTMTLYSSLFKTQQDTILYTILTQNIIPEILNKHGGDVIGNATNPLKNEIVRSYFISPENLFNKIRDVLIGNQDIGKKKDASKIDAYEFIGNFLQKEMGFTEKKALDVKYKLVAALGYFDNKKVNEVTACLILSNTIGEQEALNIGDKFIEAKNIFNRSIKIAEAETEFVEFQNKLENRMSNKGLFLNFNPTKAQSLEKVGQGPGKSPALERIKNGKNNSASLGK